MVLWYLTYSDMLAGFSFYSQKEKKLRIPAVDPKNDVRVCKDCYKKRKSLKLEEQPEDGQPKVEYTDEGKPEYTDEKVSVDSVNVPESESLSAPQISLEGANVKEIPLVKMHNSILISNKNLATGTNRTTAARRKIFISPRTSPSPSKAFSCTIKLSFERQWQFAAFPLPPSSHLYPSRCQD